MRSSRPARRIAGLDSPSRPRGGFDMTPQQRAACETFRRILRRLIALNSNFRASQMETLMGVALNPGVSITGLTKETGQSLASTSRHVADMTAPTDHYPERLGLIYVDFGRDSRTKPLRLTALGEDLVLTVTDEILETWRPSGEDR